jgi:SAM-dependent methyltransferase
VDEALKTESEKLTNSWMQHEAAKLRDYLVAGVEDPRINFQSILSRHFLVRGIFGDRFEPLIQAEYRFSAAMNWLLKLANKARDRDEIGVLLYALNHGADNAEGVEIPRYIVRAFLTLPAQYGDLDVPNYIAAFLSERRCAPGTVQGSETSLNTFRNLWQRTLLTQSAGHDTHHPALGSSSVPQVFEPACGSANDYRYLHAYGLSRFLDYTGLDLCAKNIENARALFPETRFERGNVFELAAPDEAFDFSFTHDLFEHLSPAGLHAAIKEICRVTSRAICVGFFNMDEIRDHVVRPVDEYYWNTLSMARMRDLFAQHGFAARVWHIGSFLRRQLGCDETHNPNAYTFVLRANKERPG